MKYSEFKREIEKLGFQVYNNEDSWNVIVETDIGLPIISISKSVLWGFNSGYMSFGQLGYYMGGEIINLGWRLASTPINEREDEEKRYRLRLPFAIESVSYLNISNDGIFISSVTDGIDCKTIFTESEIEEMKKEHNLDSFVLEEVKE